MADLAELLERVKAATGPDRTIDAALLSLSSPDLAVKGTSVWMRPTGSTGPHYMAAGSIAELLPTYTASLDAALALVERFRPGAYIELSGPRKYLNIPTPVPNHWCAQIVEPGHRGGWGSTAALALLDALLMALIAQSEAAVGSANLKQEK